MEKAELVCVYSMHVCLFRVMFRCFQQPWLAHFDCAVTSFALTYGVARRGERRDRSVRGRVELLLDFGADNPGKVNNRHGSINTASRAGRFHTTLKHATSRPLTPVHVQVLHRFLARLYPHIGGPPVTK